MTNLISLARCAAIAALVSVSALPALANSGAGSFNSGGNGPEPPGPGNWGGPGGLAPNPPPAAVGTPSGGGDGMINNAVDTCRNGTLVVNFQMNEDNNVIPSTLQRRCVIMR